MPKPKNNANSSVLGQEMVMRNMRYFLSSALQVSSRKVKVVHNYKSGKPEIVVNKEKITDGEKEMIDKSKDYMEFLISRC